MKSILIKITLFTIMLLCIWTSMFAQIIGSDTTATKSYARSISEPYLDTTKVTEQQVYNDIKSTLNGLSKSLKVGAEHVYEVLIRQQLITSLSKSIFLIISIIALYLFIKIGSKADWDEPNGKNLSALVGVSISFIGALMCIIELPNILTGFINPEYGVIKDISNLIHH
jgi:hypothetical protein